MKVNGMGQPAFVTKTPAAHFDGFDPAVEDFRRPITHLKNDRIKDTPPVSFDGFGGRLTSSSRPRIAPDHPRFPSWRAPGRHASYPHGWARSWRAPARAVFNVRVRHGSKRVVGRSDRWAGWVHPALSGPFEIGPSGLHPGPVFRTPPLVHGRIQTWGHVEPVQHPLLLGPGSRLQRGADRGRPPIHADPLDVLQLL